MPKSLHIALDPQADLTNIAGAHMPDRLSGSSEQSSKILISIRKFELTCIEIIQTIKKLHEF
jgi:hypothetical protein